MARDSAPKQVRRYNSHTGAFTTNCVYYRNPWVVAWWSAAFPGFGHLFLGYFVKGFLLFLWEVVINTQAEINRAMVYTFTGRFGEAQDALNPRWLLLYIPVYLFAIWDSYRKTIALNQHYLLAETEKAPIAPFRMNGLSLNAIDPRSPRLALIWSMLFPGLGHLYLNRIPGGFFIVIWCIAASYYSGLAEAFLYLIIDSPERGTVMLDPEWLCFYPSILCFAAYDAYSKALENNKLYKSEQARYLRKAFSPPTIRLLAPSQSEESRMHVISSFPHSPELELAIAALIQEGVARENIAAVPMDPPTAKGAILNALTRKAESRSVDLAAILGTAASVVGASIGFRLHWGPIVWGLIGLAAGAAAGAVIARLLGSSSTSRMHPKGGDAVLIVQCVENESERVKDILCKFSAISVGTLG